MGGSRRSTRSARHKPSTTIRRSQGPVGTTRSRAPRQARAALRIFQIFISDHPPISIAVHNRNTAGQQESLANNGTRARHSARTTIRWSLGPFGTLHSGLAWQSQVGMSKTTIRRSPRPSRHTLTSPVEQRQQSEGHSAQPAHLATRLAQHRTSVRSSIRQTNHTPEPRGSPRSRQQAYTLPNAKQQNYTVPLPNRTLGKGPAFKQRC